MRLFHCLLASAGLFFTASAANAVVWTATSSAIDKIWDQVRGGDTLDLIGTFHSTWLTNRSFAQALTINASHASFYGNLRFINVSRVNLVGGNYVAVDAPKVTYQAVSVVDSSFVNISGARFSGPGGGIGLYAHDSDHVTISGSSFKGVRIGGVMDSVTNSAIANNAVTKATSDGFDIVDSHFVSVTGNSCSGGLPYTGAHPDCVQLWSIAGRAVQSDITISNNIATGPTQGFTSFNPLDGGGLRIVITNNSLTTSFPQGIACYNCVDSTITGNVVRTALGAQYRTSINIVGGHDNVVADNDVGPLPAPAPTPAPSPAPPGSSFATLSTMAMAITDDGAAEMPAESFDLPGSTATVGSIPEPDSWWLLLAGFGLGGTMLRRRRRMALPA